MNRSNLGRIRRSALRFTSLRSLADAGPASSEFRPAYGSGHDPAAACQTTHCLGTDRAGVSCRGGE